MTNDVAQIQLTAAAEVHQAMHGCGCCQRTSLGKTGLMLKPQLVHWSGHRSSGTQPQDGQGHCLVRSEAADPTKSTGLWSQH